MGLTSNIYLHSNEVKPKAVIKVWRVKLGKMYYVNGLQRNFAEHPGEHQTFEFSSIKECAWIFAFKSDANDVAKSCGGSVDEIEISHEDHLRLKEIRESYFN